MRRLGTLLSISKQKDGVVKHNSPLDIANAIKMFRKNAYTENKETVGKIKEVYGPVDAPYISIRPKKGKNLDSLKNEELYY